MRIKLGLLITKMDEGSFPHFVNRGAKVVETWCFSYKNCQQNVENFFLRMMSDEW